MTLNINIKQILVQFTSVDARYGESFFSYVYFYLVSDGKTSPFQPNATYV